MRRVLVFVSAIVCFESTLYTVLAPLLPRFSDQFVLSKAQAGALVAAYAAGALVAAVPSGLLTTRIGVKATAVGGVLRLFARVDRRLRLARRPRAGRPARRGDRGRGRGGACGHAARPGARDAGHRCRAGTRPRRARPARGRARRPG